MENITFGELAAPPGSRRSTTTGSGGYRLFRAIIDIFERIDVLWREIERGTVNLFNNNNNIYIYIYIYIYKYIKCSTTTTTIISEGADPLRPAWRHPTEGQPPRASPEYT